MCVRCNSDMDISGECCWTLNKYYVMIRILTLVLEQTARNLRSTASLTVPKYQPCHVADELPFKLIRDSNTFPSSSDSQAAPLVYTYFPDHQYSPVSAFSSHLSNMPALFQQLYAIFNTEMKIKIITCLRCCIWKECCLDKTLIIKLLFRITISQHLTRTGLSSAV